MKMNQRLIVIELREEGGGHNTKTNKMINIDIDRLHHPLLHTLDPGVFIIFSNGIPLETMALQVRPMMTNNSCARDLGLGT